VLLIAPKIVPVPVCELEEAEARSSKAVEQCLLCALSIL
jgi:hypothetical protein